MSTSERYPITVRPGSADDLNAIAAFDHSYSTDYVWQMDHRDEDNQINITFRQVRLPRSVRVAYPRDLETLAAEWQGRRLFIVAEARGDVHGYLTVADSAVSGTGWVSEFAVERKVRRQGLGTVLITSAAHWARKAKLQRLIVEVQSKNYPAISFCQKHGFAFCGYNDRYFVNQDIALFFGLSLK
ncbi:MAG: GNAT family N-acetyltransferase [Chloroflexi bacterium]|nr:GNAT family N-acetyltransferase [Chloroflexota bacterium]